MNWPIDHIGDSGFLYRTVKQPDFLDAATKRTKPLPRCFAIHQSDSDMALSLYWSRYANERKCLAHVGLSRHSKHERLKSPSDFLVFRIEIAALRKLTCVGSITHSPIEVAGYEWGNPCNRSHTSLRYNQRPDEEDLMNMRELAQRVDVLKSVQPVVSWITANKRHLPFI